MSSQMCDYVYINYYHMPVGNDKVCINGGHAECAHNILSIPFNELCNCVYPVLDNCSCDIIVGGTCCCGWSSGIRKSECEHFSKLLSGFG